MIRILTIIFCFSFNQIIFSQNRFVDKVVSVDLKASEIPKTIKIKGDLLEAKSWTDLNGENILVISRNGPFDEDDNDPDSRGHESFVELYGSQYVKKGDNYELLWDIYDFQRYCPFDLWIGLLPNSTSITDLDKDGVSETTLVYKLTCRSDYSPSRMKVIMHENDFKMGLRGIMILKPESDTVSSSFELNFTKVDTSQLSDYEKILAAYGRFENDLDFENQPEVFLMFAKNKWLEFIVKDEFLQLY